MESGASVVSIILWWEGFLKEEGFSAFPKDSQTLYLSDLL